MPLIDKDAARIAAALDDYEHVSLKEVRPRGDGYFDVVVTDHRFDRDYALASHCDYWDFIGSVVSHVRRRTQQGERRTRRNGAASARLSERTCDQEPRKRAQTRANPRFHPLARLGCGL